MNNSRKPIASAVSGVLKAAILTSLLCLAGCSTYPSKFKGSPAKGSWGAMPMDVEIMVDNGEMELIYSAAKAIKDYENIQRYEPPLRSAATSQIIYTDERGEQNEVND